ncbi:hypothetical protein JOQ06_026483 [Pogonophryne albipinna]|uniref:Tc1-like transposase DDE domain-containing protein n=1 Tax=Pogonophryne albipinna TaxID=1090488 RepID=A0AAD6BCD3_9TELE|nr:hypothetical protein JOQ06_026483 [Pogonophryne albipinna]
MFVASNEIRLREIQARIIADQDVFSNIPSISVATIDRVLKRHHLRMKQIYKVPFERNSDRVKELRHRYVQRMMELEGNALPHVFVYVDEAGFNLSKVRRRGRNLIGQRATVFVPGQRGGNITLCAAISTQGVLAHIPVMGAYNSQRVLAFLDVLYDRLVPPEERDQVRLVHVVIWDNVAFHHSRDVRAWFEAHPHMAMEFLPPYSPFLNPIEEFFSAWRWKVYDHHPHDRMPLLDAMNAGCRDISAESCQGWCRHARRYFPRCLAREDMRCDVDEAMWPDRRQRADQ